MHSNDPFSKIIGYFEEELARFDIDIDDSFEPERTILKIFGCEESVSKSFLEDDKNELLLLYANISEKSAIEVVGKINHDFENSAIFLGQSSTTDVDDIPFCRIGMRYELFVNHKFKSLFTSELAKIHPPQEECNLHQISMRLSA